MTGAGSAIALGAPVLLGGALVAVGLSGGLLGSRRLAWVERVLPPAQTALLAGAGLFWLWRAWSLGRTWLAAAAAACLALGVLPAPRKKERAG